MESAQKREARRPSIRCGLACGIAPPFSPRFARPRAAPGVSPWPPPAACPCGSRGNPCLRGSAAARDKNPTCFLSDGSSWRETCSWGGREEAARQPPVCCFWGSGELCAWRLGCLRACGSGFHHWECGTFPRERMDFTDPADLVTLPKHILDIWVIVLIILATILVMTALVLCPATAVIIYRVRTHPTRNGIV
ncbi:small integral membrane protein 3 [Buteo buteo]|uniref:small integral membrane protein 3 n=1 Tax=Buteo buteo TaxID=30397 RepID=UPI003EBB4F60